MVGYLVKALPLVLALMALTAAVVLATTGTTDSPDTPANTLSYTLEDIYNRLDSGAPGSQSAFTEPSVGPGTGTMYTLNEIMELLKSTYTRIPKTGQTGCWDEVGISISCTGTGQDGEYQLGVLPNQVPSLNSNTGAYTAYGWGGSRFTDNGDGTVSDNLTGLVWLKDANCAGSIVDWETALSYSNALFDGYTNCFGTTGDCGLSDGSSDGDWRLPNINELHSLIDVTQFMPALPAGHPFTRVQIIPNSIYWSSTTVSGLYSSAIILYMEDGLVNGDEKSLPSYWVWPVRGGY